jgi:glycosyltransferase involved in cell wall biosynthesis
MKIGMIVPGGVDRGGREHVVPALLWLIEALARRHDVHVLVLDYYPEPCSYRLLGATVHDLGRVGGLRGTRRLRIERRLAAALAAHGPFDVLHAYWGMPAGVVTTRLSRSVNTPVVVTFDSGEFVRCDDIRYGLQRRWIDRRAIRAAVRAADAVTVPTAFMQRLAARHGAHPAVIPVGVDVSRFPRAARADGPPWRLIRVASLNQVKDYPNLLRAFAHLVARAPAANDVHNVHDIHLDIVGEDTLGGEIQSLSDRLGLAARVTFHGAQPTDRVSSLYARAHLNIVSSRHESANVTVLEAACTGLPTVGTAVGYVSDLQPDGAIGVPVQDPVALADAIEHALRDPERRDRIGRAARAWAVAHDAEWTARRFEKVYEEITPAASHQEPRPVPRSDTPRSA